MISYQTLLIIFSPILTGFIIMIGYFFKANASSHAKLWDIVKQNKENIAVVAALTGNGDKIKEENK